MEPAEDGCTSDEVDFVTVMNDVPEVAPPVDASTEVVEVAAVEVEVEVPFSTLR